MTVVDLAERRTLRIGGSEAAAACGVDPFRSRVMLWAEKTGKAEREQTEAMRWGNLLEPVIRDELRVRGYDAMAATDLAEMPNRMLGDGRVQHPEHSWMSGHPDGLVYQDNKLGVLEIKTGSHWSAHDWRTQAGAPLPYIVQVQHYLALTGLDVGLLACLVAGQKLELRTVERDERLIAAMIEREQDFLGYVQRDEPPPPDGSESARDAIRALYPEASGETIRLSQAGWERCKLLKQRQDQLKAVKRQADELQQAIQLEMGEASVAVSPFDSEACKWTSHERTALDTRRFKAERPELFGLFAETTSVRRFTLS